jgi:S1-C subfamily serine protease
LLFYIFGGEHKGGEMRRWINWLCNVVITLLIVGIVVLHFVVLGGIYTQGEIASQRTITAIETLADTIYYNQRKTDERILNIFEYQATINSIADTTMEELSNGQRLLDKKVLTLLSRLEDVIDTQESTNNNVLKISRQAKMKYEELKELRDALRTFDDRTQEPDYNLILKSTVTIYNLERMTMGSGVCIIYKGEKYIISAFHLDEAIEIYADDGGRRVKLELVIQNPLNDLILFKAKDELNTVKYINFVDTEVNVGDRIWVCGNPMGIEDALTYGVIVRKSEDKLKFLVDAPVWFGNSGGGAFNRNTELVGIASQLLIDVRPENLLSQSYGVIVSIDIIEEFLGQLE